MRELADFQPVQEPNEEASAASSSDVGSNNVNENFDDLFGKNDQYNDVHLSDYEVTFHEMSMNIQGENSSVAPSEDNSENLDNRSDPGWRTNDRQGVSSDAELSDADLDDTKIPAGFSVVAKSKPSVESSKTSATQDPRRVAEAGMLSMPSTERPELDDCQPLKEGEAKSRRPFLDQFEAHQNASRNNDKVEADGSHELAFGYVGRSSNRSKPKSTAEASRKQVITDNMKNDSQPSEMDVDWVQGATDLAQAANGAPFTGNDKRHSRALSRHISFHRQPGTSLAVSTGGEQSSFRSRLAINTEKLTASRCDDNEMEVSADVVSTSHSNPTSLTSIEKFQEASISRLDDLNQSGEARPHDEQDDDIFADDDMSNHRYTQSIPVAKARAQLQSDTSEYDNELQYREHDDEPPRAGTFQTPRNVRVTFLGDNDPKASTITPLSSQGTVIQSTSTPSVQGFPQSILRKRKADEEVMDTEYTHGLMENTNTAYSQVTRHVHVQYEESVGAAVSPANASSPSRAVLSPTWESDIDIHSYQTYLPIEQYEAKPSVASPSGNHFSEDTESYEYHQAKFLNEISDTEDLQRKNASKILGMEYTLAPNMATILNYRAGLLDLLKTAEEAEDLADEILQGFQDFS